VICPAGNPQPAYKLEGMKIIMEFPKPKNPEEAGAMQEVERKQVTTCICSVLCTFSRQAGHDTRTPIQYRGVLQVGELCQGYRLQGDAG
jgi:hypothetical protein